MNIPRRTFLSTATGAAAAMGLRPDALTAASAISPVAQIPGDRFDPWIEVDPVALESNVAEITRLTGGRPILAVVKNNAYGLGLATACRILEPLSSIVGFAVVKMEAAFALREAGIRKPVYLMAMFPEKAAADLAQHDIRPCLYSENSLRLTQPMTRVLGAPVKVQLYLDTGMSRMGVPYHRALPWIEELVASGNVAVEGTFMGFTEDPEFDREQLKRFLSVAEHAARANVQLGELHAASSSAVFEFPDAHLDMVRPGMAMYGGYPNDPRTQKELGALRCAVRLKARVVRVEQLRMGDSVSYGRNYVAQVPTWVATLPVGHTDGYPRRAVDGARILIGSQTYPVIGAISASHTIVELGAEKTVAVGDVATLIGPDAKETDPNWISVETGTSVYDLFMHLNPSLPKIIA